MSEQNVSDPFAGLPEVFDFLYTHPVSFYSGGQDFCPVNVFPYMVYASSGPGAWDNVAGDMVIRRFSHEGEGIGDVVIGACCLNLTHVIICRFYSWIW